MIDARLEKVEDYIRAHQADPTLSVSRLAEFVSVSEMQLYEIVFPANPPRDLVDSYRLWIVQALFLDVEEKKGGNHDRLTS